MILPLRGAIATTSGVGVVLGMRDIDT